ncbi:MAG TPA: glycerate kinase [Acidimicrobiales bacterium]|nr:glycerate kinase [Acidimicrobiales bacterium]
MRILAAPDKFRGTASASAIAAAVAEAARRAGWGVDAVAVSDGGEGLLEVLGGSVRHTEVTGPLGGRVAAEWRLKGDTAVVEMAMASGLDLAGGPAGNDAMNASTTGTGELIEAALGAGARTVIVGLGGSATTDGGLGCVEALRPHGRLAAVDLIAACDVSTTFVDAADLFAGQKGATAAEVALLHRRLDRLAQLYEDSFGVDVRDLPGSGAAGGLGGGLAAIGARLVPGFDLVADSLGLEDRIDGVDLVITGEGLLDAQSFNGKAVGGMVELAAEAGTDVLVIVGEIDDGFDLATLPPGVEVVSLVERFGRERAMADVERCVAEVVDRRLSGPIA